jgi:thiol-disulfide isomerase/thioredoxin
MSHPLPSRLLAVALSALVGLMLAGCTGVDGTGDKGYISGDGQISLVEEADRGEPIELEGTTLDDEPLSLADLRGEVVVVNVWWSQCPPCRTEMPLLVEAAERTEGEASFVGLNVRDTAPEPGRSFLRTFDPPYPSLFDPTGEGIIAFAGVLSPRSIPSTVVLDAQGRVAATVIGPVPSTTTLTDLVEEVAAGSSAASGRLDG